MGNEYILTKQNKSEGIEKLVSDYIEFKIKALMKALNNLPRRYDKSGKFCTKKLSIKI